MIAKKKKKTTNIRKTKTKPKSPNVIAVLDAARYRIAGVEDYCWNCYGKNARFIDIEVPLSVGEAHAIVDTKDGRVFEITACDYRLPRDQQAYRWISPTYRRALLDEAIKRDCDSAVVVAWDDTKWVHVPMTSVLERIKSLVVGGASPKPKKAAKKKARA